MWYLCRRLSDRSLRQDKSPLQPDHSEKKDSTHLSVMWFVGVKFKNCVDWCLITKSAQGGEEACGSVSEGRAANTEAGDINIQRHNVFNEPLAKIKYTIKEEYCRFTLTLQSDIKTLKITNQKVYHRQGPRFPLLLLSYSKTENITNNSFLSNRHYLCWNSILV